MRRDPPFTVRRIWVLGRTGAPGSRRSCAATVPGAAVATTSAAPAVPRNSRLETSPSCSVGFSGSLLMSGVLQSLLRAILRPARRTIRQRERDVLAGNIGATDGGDDVLL